MFALLEESLCKTIDHSNDRSQDPEDHRDDCQCDQDWEYTDYQRDNAGEDTRHVPYEQGEIDVVDYVWIYDCYHVQYAPFQRGFHSSLTRG